MKLLVSTVLGAGFMFKKHLSQQKKNETKNFVNKIFLVF